MATRKKKINIGAFGHPIYGKGFAKYDEMRPNGSSETPNDLEEAAESHTKTKYGLTRLLGAEMKEVEDDFIAGAKWQKEQDGKELSEKIATAYQLGLANKEKQMMKEAVEGKVFMSFAPGHNQMVMADVDLPTNTKVRIIIVKEDEK